MSLLPVSPVSLFRSLFQRNVGYICSCCSVQSKHQQNAERRGSDDGSLHSKKMVCSATNRLITAKDHASVQLNIGHLDESGVYTGQFSTAALCGFIRAQGDADSAVDRFWSKTKVEVRQQ